MLSLSLGLYYCVFLFCFGVKGNVGIFTVISTDSYRIIAQNMLLSLEQKWKGSKEIEKWCITINITSQNEDILRSVGCNIRSYRNHIIELYPQIREFSHLRFGRYKYTWDKLYVFQEDTFEKILFLDADMIIVEPLDELLTYPVHGYDLFAVEGAPYFNSGLMLFHPSHQLSSRLMSELSNLHHYVHQDVGNGEQNYLSGFFFKWGNVRMLDRTYNCLRKQRMDKTFQCKVLHFAGQAKTDMIEWMTIKPIRT
jgi:lipopolysaccharide biosynthesis glycosyltransferase